MTLIQTRKIQDFPIVLMCREYWRPLEGLLKQMLETGTISASDLDLLLLTDSSRRGDGSHPETRGSAIRVKRVPRPSKLLRE